MPLLRDKTTPMRNIHCRVGAALRVRRIRSIAELSGHGAPESRYLQRSHVARARLSAPQRPDWTGLAELRCERQAGPGVGEGQRRGEVGKTWGGGPAPSRRLWYRLKLSFRRTRVSSEGVCLVQRGQEPLPEFVIL